MTVLASTVQSVEWLKQFDAPDYTTASYMVNTLLLVRTETVEAYLSSEIGRICPSGPVALYAVTKVPKGSKSYFSNDGVPPTAATHGSTKIIEAVIFKMSRMDPTRYLDHPSRKTLKDHRVQNVWFLDDSCASGRRASQFVRWWFTSHRDAPGNAAWLRGWLSSRMRLHMAAYAISDAAEGPIRAALPGSGHPSRKRRERLFLHSALTIRTGEWAPGTPRELVSDIRRVAATYAKKHQLPHSRALGFGDSLSYVVFQHSAPNNIPAILNCRSVTWSPLFIDRSVGRSASALFTNATEQRSLREETQRVVNHILSNQQETDRPWVSRFRLVLVALLRFRRVESLAHVIGRSQRDILSLLALAQTHGLVEPDTQKSASWRLTVYGKRMARQTLKGPTQTVRTRYPSLSSIYVPQSFRAGQRAIQP